MGSHPVNPDSFAVSEKSAYFDPLQTDCKHAGMPEYSRCLSKSGAMKGIWLSTVSMENNVAGSDKTGQPAFDESVPDVSASPDETVVSFHYDALDALIGRSASEGREQRFYRNDKLVNDIRGANSCTFVRVDELVLAEQQAGGAPKTLLLVGDDKNSVLSEISQEAVKGIVYSPYGHRAEDGAVNGHLGYNGERRETQTGWYLLGKGYRVFNPLLMRFHSPDNLSPFGNGGLNAYMYCVGDPINNVDPTGHSPWGWLFRGLRRISGSHRVTTATSGYNELPDILARNTKSRPTTLYPIKSKHVVRLKKRALLFWDEAGKAGAKNSPKFEQYKREAELASEALDFAAKNVGEPSITREGAAIIKRTAESYDSIMAKRAKNRKDNVRMALAYKIEKVRKQGGRNGDQARYLGYDPHGD